MIKQKNWEGVHMSEAKYSNSIQVQLQAFDAQIKFAFQDADETTELVNIVLSPQHLKILYQMLGGAVEQYEKEFGNINIPKNAKLESEMQERE